MRFTTLFKYSVLLALFCCSTSPLLAQVHPAEYPNEAVSLTTADAVFRSVRESDGLEQDIQCGNGVYAVSPLEIGDTRLFIYRIYAVGTIPEIDGEVLLVENIRLRIGDFYEITYPDGFQAAIVEGEYLEVHVTFHAKCYGFYGDEVRFKTSAQNCRYRIQNEAAPGAGAQLSVYLTHFDGNFQNVRPLGTVLPGSFVPRFRNSPSIAEPKRIWLDIRNSGTEDLIINSVEIDGPAFPVDMFLSSLVFDEPIPPGAQRFFFLEVEDTDCIRRNLDIKFVSNRSVGCSEVPNVDKFRVVVRPDINCSTPQEDDNDEGEVPPIKDPGAKVFATTEQAASFVLYPTVTQQLVTLASENVSADTPY
ncbi:MAG: hypothetical protein AAGA62_16925, partial [Bacteroidota bacterium]